MKFKRIFLMFMGILSLSILLTSCGKNDKVSLKTENTEFVNLSPDYDMPTTSLKTYFIDGSEIRYVDVKEFMKALKGFYMTSYMRVSSTLFSDDLKLFFYVATETGTEKVTATFDWSNDTITISNPMFFNIIEQSSETDFQRLILESDGDQSEFEPLTIKLSDYDYGIYTKNGKCLVPFSIMNTVFCSYDYYNIYYDGTKYFGLTYDLTYYGTENTKILKTCSLNNAEQSEELRLETYNHLRFVMDYYYGLKEHKNIDVDTLLESYKDDILSTDVEVNKNAYYDLFVKYLDELHTRIGAYSFYYDPEASALKANWDKETTSASRLKYLEVEEKLAELSKDYYSNGNTYRIEDDTCVIYLDSFVTGTDEQISADDGYLYDTYEFMMHVMNEIEAKNISNVVVDLSINGGGNMGALIRALGFLSNNGVKYYSYNYLFDLASSATMNVDVDNDGDYADNDGYTQYNWYVLTSYNTFSAANSFAAMAKSLGATIIGQKSGGGMCSVLPIILPDQTTIEMSSPSAQMAEIDGKYVYIEDGITPDIYIDYEKFYDISYIDSVLE